MKQIRKLSARLSLLVMCLLVGGVTLAACGASASTPAKVPGAGKTSVGESTATDAQQTTAWCMPMAWPEQTSASHHFARYWHGGFDHHRCGLPQSEFFEKVSSYLGVQPEHLRSELRSGKSLAEIAGPQKTQGLIEMLVSTIDQRVDTAQKNGEISSERASEIKSHVREGVTRAVNTRWGNWSGWGHPSGWWHSHNGEPTPVPPRNHGTQ